VIFDTASAHQYDSWTDNDLVRAIKLDPDCKDEYLTELAERRAERARMKDATDALDADIAAKIKELTNGNT
jgi:hypothetical protein